MGSEQSSRREREREYREYLEERANRESAATARDVEKALEQQRKLYEEKIKELIQEKKPTTSTATDQKPILCNSQLYSLQPNTTYQDLRAVGNSNPLTLYPKLGDSGSPTWSPQNVTTSPSYGNNNAFSGDFVCVNSSRFPHSPQRLQPTAPPIEDFQPTNSRSRSQSRQRSPSDITCRTCGNLFKDKIYQCNQGHSSCNMCKMRQVACRQCRQQLTNRRNFDLEKYVSERRVECPNSTDGCRLQIKIADMEIHAKECPFKPLQCPSLGKCSWIGKLSQLLIHFDEMHPTNRQGKVGKEMFLSNVVNTSHTMQFVQIGPFNFLFHIKVSEADRRLCMAVQLIGTKHSAAKWNYEIHVYNKSQAQRKYSYIDRCSSSSEPINEIFESANCAVVPQEYAMTFICKGVLAYKFYIKRGDTIKKTKENVKNVYSKRGRRPQTLVPNN